LYTKYDSYITIKMIISPEYNLRTCKVNATINTHFEALNESITIHVHYDKRRVYVHNL